MLIVFLGFDYGSKKIVFMYMVSVMSVFLYRPYIAGNDLLVCFVCWIFIGIRTPIFRVSFFLLVVNPFGFFGRCW